MPQTLPDLKIAVRKFGPFESAVVKLWEAFCLETGRKLTLEAVAMDLPELHRRTLAEGGLQNGDWDMAHISTDWITGAWQDGAVADLSPYIEQTPPADFPHDWPSALLQMQTQENHILGLPFHDGPLCLIYRKDLFEDPVHSEQFARQFGRPLAAPRTWEEFWETAVFFRRPEAHLAGLVAAAYPDGHNLVFDFCVQLWTRGGELLNDEGRIVIDTAAAREALSFYRRLQGPGGVVDPACHRYESVQAGMAFSRGEAAMMINWFGFAAFCDTDPASVVRGRVDVAALPSGGTPVSLNSYWLYAVGSGSARKALAYEFIRFAISPQGDRLLTLEGGIGCRLSTAEDDEINRRIPYYHKLASLHRHARCLPPYPRWPEVARILDAVMLETMHTTAPVSHILEKGQQKLKNLIDHDRSA